MYIFDMDLTLELSKPLDSIHSLLENWIKSNYNPDNIDVETSNQCIEFFIYDAKFEKESINNLAKILMSSLCDLLEKTGINQSITMTAKLYASDDQLDYELEDYLENMENIEDTSVQMLYPGRVFSVLNKPVVSMQDFAVDRVIN
jgi:hypothetical protein